MNVVWALLITAAATAAAVTLTSPKLRIALLSIGCAVVLLTALWIGTSPVSVAV